MELHYLKKHIRSNTVVISLLIRQQTLFHTKFDQDMDQKASIVISFLKILRGSYLIACMQLQSIFSLP